MLVHFSQHAVFTLMVFVSEFDFVSNCPLYHVDLNASDDDSFFLSS